MPPAPPPMRYGEYLPQAELAPWVAAHWHFAVIEGAGEIEHWIPLTGGAMLSIAPGGGAMLSGPRTTPLVTTVRGGDVFWGTHFWPGAAAALLGIGGEDLRERETPLATGWAGALAATLRGATGEEAACAALDAALGALLPGASPLDGPVMTAVFRILAAGGETTTADLVAASGLSERQLRRRFRRAVGLTPKELARIQRARQSAVAAVSEAGARWVEIAARHGYADQAHLVREFRRLLGITPGAFATHAGRIRHARLVR